LASGGQTDILLRGGLVVSRLLISTLNSLFSVSHGNVIVCDVWLGTRPADDSPDAVIIALIGRQIRVIAFATNGYATPRVVLAYVANSFASGTVLEHNS
jgi:hypothetical protein